MFLHDVDDWLMVRSNDQNCGGGPGSRERGTELRLRRGRDQNPESFEFGYICNQALP